MAYFIKNADGSVQLVFEGRQFSAAAWTHDEAVNLVNEAEKDGRIQRSERMGLLRAVYSFELPQGEAPPNSKPS